MKDYYNLFVELSLQQCTKNDYTMFLKELKKRNKIEICNLNKIPYELKSLIYFLKPSVKDWETINQFLINTHK